MAVQRRQLDPSVARAQSLSPPAGRGDLIADVPTIAALFVEAGGTYANLPGVDLWDEARDARLYDGPHPVVAHPPCARWCQLAGLVEARYGYKKGDDGGSFEAALRAVRTYGGVLEHPAYSKAWPAFGLPEPRTTGGWTQSLFDEGAVAYVEQHRYGHPARKATWLYAVGCELPELHWHRWRDREFHGAIVSFVRYRERGLAGRQRLRVGLSSRTPDEFRDVLLGMARSVRVPPSAVAA